MCWPYLYISIWPIWPILVNFLIHFSPLKTIFTQLSCTLLSDSQTISGNTTTCALNRCTCTNGVRAEGENCVENQAEICRSCLIGYRLIINDDGSKTCESCPDGFFVDSFGECSLRKCICENGMASEGAKCPNNGAQSCSLCDTGFHEITIESAEESELLGFARTAQITICNANVCGCTGKSRQKSS